MTIYLNRTAILRILYFIFRSSLSFSLPPPPTHTLKIFTIYFNVYFFVVYVCLDYVDGGYMRLHNGLTPLLELAIVAIKNQWTNQSVSLCWCSYSADGWRPTSYTSKTPWSGCRRARTCMDACHVKRWCHEALWPELPKKWNDAWSFFFFTASLTFFVPVLFDFSRWNAYRLLNKRREPITYLKRIMTLEKTILAFD